MISTLLRYHIIPIGNKENMALASEPTPTSPDTSNDRITFIQRDANGVGTKQSVLVQELFEDAGVGYTTGAGSSVTQLTSITTGVTINAKCGQITTVSQTVAAAGEATFTVTNSDVAATDTIIVNIGTHTSAGTFIAYVSTVAAGSFDITLSNLHASAAGDDTLTINFAVVDAVAS